ncbi:MAG: 2-C-methyl-D-erythritol 2,4-cyclodiphosphate synthase [Armatimonadota bacterium]|nr:2-C-methyl-D-erythritol 2,4-cyclodiphosphate synthase [Armatimonadota bacterium]
MIVFGVLLAAGLSTRFRQSDPTYGNKLLRHLPDGRPVWKASFDALMGHPRVDAVGIVAAEENLPAFRASGAAYVLPGGANRAESCRIGVEAAPPGSLVLVHDAARPFVRAALIDRVIDAGIQFGSSIPLVPVIDTIKAVRDGRIEATLRRGDLFRAQTPQASLRETLLEAMATSPAATDEAEALEAAGVTVQVVEGEESNIKITTVHDLPKTPMTPSTGSGFDIHAFSDDPNRPLILGGVRFENERGLEGHSDADVVLHAVTDAILGAIGGGDIGELFPNDDAAYKDADSMIFLREAAKRVGSVGGRIVSIDITILAEAPKLIYRRPEIRTRISQELGLQERRINVKATTMEGLGAIGRNEGIAAMATATVLCP